MKSQVCLALFALFSMNITQTQTRLGSAFHSMDVILISTQIYNEGEENVGVFTTT
jgi:hypothetical protein